MLLYRNIGFGRLANFMMLDTRQYRSDQPNGDGQKPLEGQVFHPKATMLGATQENWLNNQLASDIHSNWANELKIDFDDPDSQNVATEFVGTSISSGGNGHNRPKYLDQLLSENPFVKYHIAERGYVECEVSPKEWRIRYQTVEYVDRPGAPVQTRAEFAVEAGRPILHQG